MSRIAILLCLLFAAPLVAKSTVGVAPVLADDPAAATQMRDTLIREAKMLDGQTVISKTRMDRSARRAKKLGIRCDAGDAGCFARVGAFSNITLVLVAELIGGADTLRLRLVRSAGGTVMRDVTVLLSPVAAERSAGIVAAIRAVVLGESLAGMLEVEVSSPDASISVDGRLLGKSPLESPLEGISPGRRTVQVTKSGFLPFQTEVEILAGNTARVSALLTALPVDKPPPDIVVPPDDPPETTTGPGVLFWSSTSLALVSGVAAGGFGAGAFLSSVSESDRPNLPASEFNERAELSTNLGYGAIAAGAVAGLFALVAVVALVVE